jgi:hypothetical protein
MKNVLIVSSLAAIDVCVSTTAFADLINCKPVKNCRAGSKPCFVEVTQRDWLILLGSIASSSFRSLRAAPGRRSRESRATSHRT